MKSNVSLKEILTFAIPFALSMPFLVVLAGFVFGENVSESFRSQILDAGRFGLSVALYLITGVVLAFFLKRRKA